MNERTNRIWALAILGLYASAGWAGPITTGTLLREMIDLRPLADFPSPAYQTVQFSSYDRRSAIPGGPAWFANSDGFGKEPLPNFAGVLKAPDDQGIGEYLICDVDGPGAIVRTWTAAIAGSIRLYLDGAVDPIYDGPAQEFLRCPYRTYARAAGIADSLLDGTFIQRNAAYCPIPFARRCRMVWTGNVQQIHFYQVQVRRYEPAAEVVTFQPRDLKTHKMLLETAARVMRDPAGEYVYASANRPTVISTTVAAGQVQEALRLTGPRALERLSLKVDAHELDQALRQTILHIVCDEHPRGQVQAPLGDFFGAAPGVNPFNSVPFTVLPDGTMTCRYVMPFKSSLKILIDNRGEQPVTVTGSSLPMDYTWNDRTSMHFRARWRVDHDLVASRAAQDMPYLIAHGSGVYVGTALFLLNPCAVPTPGGGWWGEGDEKIFVDDDRKPSTFGTGSEDYFNYAWSSPDIFLLPYCGQPRNDGPGNRGFVTNQRWHIVDCLPFQERIAFYMELLSHDRTPGLSYARIAYHYAKPGLTDDHVSITDEDVRPLSLPPDWQPAARFAMRDSVFHQAEELLRGDANTSFARDNLWAGGRLLLWHPSRRGDQLVLSLPVGEDGPHLVHLGLALTRDSGTISVTLDGTGIGLGDDSGAIDLHAPHRVLLRQFGSDKIDLAKGEHLLTVQYKGPLEPTTGTAIGVDYVAVQKK